MLSTEQAKFYHKEGYLLPGVQLFDSEGLGQLERIYQEYADSNSGIPTDELDTPHFSDSRLLEFLFDPSVLDIVEGLIGPNIGLWSSHFIAKPALTGRRTPWHEDSAYWEGKFDRLDKIVTIWLALDRSDRENGCMGVIPGTHINGFSSYTEVEDKNNSTFEFEIDQDNISDESIVWFELEKGQYSLHDGRIIHGAWANNSQRRRCGYTMRYFSLDMKFNQAAAPDHRLWHARGENIGNNPLEPNPFI